MYCICCKKDKVRPHQLEEESEEDLLWKIEIKNDKEYTINNQMVDDGIIHIIEAGYGSRHDGDRLILAICDDCIKENLEDGTLLYFNNYMSFSGQYVKNELDKSKKIFKRRKNLDNLLR